MDTPVNAMTCKAGQRGGLTLELVLVIGLVICMAAAMGVVAKRADSRGYNRAKAEAAKVETARKEADDEERKRQDGEAKASAQRLRDEADQLTTQLKEAKDHAKTLQTERDSALRAGTQRMSIRAAKCVPAAVSADGTAKPGAAGPEEARADLIAEDATEILAITDDGDDAIRDLNACIDRYNGADAEIERYKARLKGLPHVEAAKPAKPD